MKQLVPRGKVELERAALIVAGLSPAKPWRITIAPYRSKRSPEQNSLLWAIYEEIARETGNEKQDIHEAMKARFLDRRFLKLGDESLPIPASSTALDTMEFSEFVEKVQAFAAQELGIQLFAHDLP